MRNMLLNTGRKEILYSSRKPRRIVFYNYMEGRTDK